MERPALPSWRIWIDTGGTFTDGVALAPDGAMRRVKILSSAALRGTVERRLTDSRLRLSEDGLAPPESVRGFRFRPLRRQHPERTVVACDPVARTLDLSGPLESWVAEGLPFELVSDEEAPTLAARLLTGTPAGHDLPRCSMRLATTLGTNALLQRAGAPTALFVTRGFGDLPSIGTQQRPELFALSVEKPAPLYAAVIEVNERLAADGRVLQPLDTTTLTDEARKALARGVNSAAIALLHGYLNPSHERRLRDALLELGFKHVSCSSELAPRIKLLPRLQTAVVDAYLSPVVRDYLDRVDRDLGREPTDSPRLLVMTSAGGLLDRHGYRPKDSLLSGPAGGVVGAARVARLTGHERVIGFDMGGTSTDVARFDGDYEYVYEHRVGDARVAAPALAIESVASGGGSICWLDGERLRVGPRSAGALPGPACYGAGGPLTVTDVNLLAGWLAAQRFEIPVSVEPARERLTELQDELERRTGERATDRALLEGLQTVANETMADAIRRISLRRGYDPTDYALVAFGGAGGQHACQVAELLGIERIVVPVDAALLSALGLGQAVIERFVERQVLQPLERAEASIEPAFRELSEEALRAVAAVGVPPERIAVRRRILHLRFSGQNATLDVEWRPGMAVEDCFVRRYVELFGHRPERRAVELESMRVVASSLPSDDIGPRAAVAQRPAAAREHRDALFMAGWGRVAVFEREALEPGDRIDGAALIHERHSCTVVQPAWTACVDGLGNLTLERQRAARGEDEVVRPEAIRLELFTQRFHHIVRGMGERLERTAVSTNVKERLDFSCGLLDRDGELVVNAPHIPVHLGALGLCVRRVREKLPLGPGDVVVTNHPSFGGSHLPDVTVITPVFVGAEGPLAYLASRAHHAEIGGTRPGSMPPTARCLAEEGVVLPPTYVIRRGEPRWSEIQQLLEGAPHPSRNVADNLADLRAAVAANHAGAQALQSLAKTHGETLLERYMGRLKRLAERRIREALSELPDGRYEATERLDDGSPLAVRIDIEGDGARIDFSGSADVHPGNLNATPAVVHSVVIYVLRLLLREPLPLNEGLLRAVTIDLPRGLLNPEFPDDPLRAPAVVGGNTETSQRLVDTLLRALQLAACSQGTMNNLIFGNERYGYYETLGGGCGARPGYPGASAVHSHMTNTRITDPEILEHRYPVRVERFGIRRGSGGEGAFRGGDGLIRDLRFLEPASVSILSQHRQVEPYGLAGGAPGRSGEQWVIRHGGQRERLGSIDGCEVEAGDRLIVETPGGGGYGEPR